MTVISRFSNSLKIYKLHETNQCSILKGKMIVVSSSIKSDVYECATEWVQSFFFF